MPATFLRMEVEVEAAEVKLQRIEALLARWRAEDRQMRREHGTPLLGGVVVTCAEEVEDALNGT